MIPRMFLVVLAGVWAVPARTFPPPPHQVLEGHTGWVGALAFSCDEKTLASGEVVTGSPTIRLWDLATGKQRAALKAPSAGIKCLAFSPQGDLLAVAGRTDGIVLWDLSTQTVKAVLKGAHLRSIAIAFSPDGSLLASSGHEKTVEVWDVKTGRVKFVLRGHKDLVTAVAFATDGKTLATGSHDLTVRIWDATTGKEIRALDHRGMVNALAFGSRGDLAVATTADLFPLQGRQGATLDDVRKTLEQPDEVVVWDLMKGHIVSGLPIETGHVCSMACCRDLLFLGTRAEFLASGKELPGQLYLGRPFQGQSKKVAPARPFAGQVSAVSVSTSGRWLAAAGSDRAIRLWDMQRLHWEP